MVLSAQDPMFNGFFQKIWNLGVPLLSLLCVPGQSGGGSHTTHPPTGNESEPVSNVMLLASPLGLNTLEVQERFGFAKFWLIKGTSRN